MWTRRSRTLIPLTRVMSSKVKFKWKKIEQDYFNEIKRTADCNTLSTYPDFNETFKIHTNNSAFHTYFLHPGMDRTGAMILQYLYWPVIRHADQKVGTNCYNFLHTK